MSKAKLWVEKYRPTNLSNLILTEELKDLFSSYIAKERLPHLLFCGLPGIGKDSTANALIEELGAEVCYVDCGQNGTISEIRTRVSGFCNAMGMPGEYRIVFLREAHKLKPDTQTHLLTLIEEHQGDDISFILTANYINKIEKALQSRCQHVVIKTEVKDIIRRCVEILKEENIEFDKPTLELFVEKVVKEKNPDIRSIISILEMWSINGTLTDRGIVNSDDMKKLCQVILSNKIKSPHKLRQVVLKDVGAFGSDYEVLLAYLFNEVMEDCYDIDSVTKIHIQLHIADRLANMAVVLDKEIQFAAFLIELVNMLNG